MSINVPSDNDGYLYSLNPNNRPPNNPLNKPLTIVFCLPGNKFSHNFLLSWSELMMYCFSHNIKPIISCRQSCNIYMVRSMCLGADILRGTKQKPFNGELDYDFIMWIDSDQVFGVKQFTDLLRHNKDVVSGMYLMQGGRRFAVVENWNEKHFIENGSFEFLSREKLGEWMKKNYLGEPKEVDVGNGQKAFSYADCEFPLIKASYTGMGWMLMKKGVLEKLDYPWFESETFRYKKIVDGKEIEIADFCMEDVAFCKKLERLGIPIYVDVKAIVGHEKSVIL